MPSRLATRQILQTGEFLVERKLPGSGELLVEVGDLVTPSDPIGQVMPPDRLVVVNVAQALGIKTDDSTEFLLKGEADTVEEGDIMAETKGRFGFLSRRVCRAPVSGCLKTIFGNWVLIEKEAEAETITASVTGQIAKIHPNTSVTIAVTGTHIEATCGIGAEAYGPLRCISSDVLLREDDNQDDEDQVDQDESKEEPKSDLAGAILAIAGMATPEVVQRAAEAEAAGLIAGGIDGAILDMDVSFPVIATEGFGDYSMATDIWTALQAHEETVILLQGTDRPAIIMAESEMAVERTQTALTATIDEAVLGRRVRVLRAPYFAQQGHIARLPDKPQTTEAGIRCAGAEIVLAEETKFIPWSNLTYIS